MISIENLYWILSSHLLRPTGLDGVYYHPFGTTQNLSIGEFLRWRPGHDHHALFHFDQEPLYDKSLGRAYDLCASFYSTRIIKLLANSEHSDTKDAICQERSMLDWYYFYHGFASSYWFNDARYLGNLHEPKKVFCSLNHIIRHKRSYRMALTARLFRDDLIKYGDISFHAETADCDREINDSHSLLSQLDKTLISQHLCRRAHDVALYVDGPKIDGSFSAKFGHQEYRLWQNSIWHLVNETVFYDKKLHLTEKIFKPIVAMRPFVLVAAPGNLKYLRSYGFQTFNTWIDESYDDIIDNDQRLEAITSEIGRLCALSPRQLHTMLDDMSAVLIHNKTHFFNQFRNIIVDELVDNFDRCIRIWNNGRVDPGRIIPRNYDTDLVKQILKQ